MTSRHSTDTPVQRNGGASDAPESDGSGPTALPAFVGVLWRHKIAVLIGIVVGALLGVGVSLVQPTSYSASSRIFFSSHEAFDPLSGGSYTSDPSRHLAQQAALLTSQPVLLEAVRSDSSIGTAQQVRNALTVTAANDADIVTVKATAGTAAQAEDRISSVVKAFRSYQKDSVEQQTKELSKLTNAGGRGTIQQRAALYGDGVQLVEPPTAQQTSTAVFNGVVGAVVGLLLALAWAVARAARVIRPRRRNPKNRVPDWGTDHHVADEAPAVPSPSDAVDQAPDFRTRSLAHRS